MRAAIAAQEAMRPRLGDATVELGLKPLRALLESLLETEALADATARPKYLGFKVTSIIAQSPRNLLRFQKLSLFRSPKEQTSGNTRGTIPEVVFISSRTGKTSRATPSC